MKHYHLKIGSREKQGTFASHAEAVVAAHLKGRPARVVECACDMGERVLDERVANLTRSANS